MGRSILHFELFRIIQVELAIYRAGSATARSLGLKRKTGFQEETGLGIK